MGVVGLDSSGLGKGLELLFRGWGGDEADRGEAKKRGQEGGKDGVARGDGLGQVGVDKLRVPEDGDEGAGGDTRNGRGRRGPFPEEGRQNDGRQSGGVDRVGVEGFLKNGMGAEGLVERPETEENDQKAADEENIAVRCLGPDVADVNVVDEIGGGREEIVVGGGDDLGEDGADQECAEQVRKRVERGVGEDLAGVFVDLAGGKECGADDGERDDDGLENEDADEPANDGAGSVLFRFGGEELLVHGLVAEHEEAGGQEEFEGADSGKVAEDLKVRGGKCGGDGRPAAGDVRKNWQRDEQRERGEQADGEVHVGDRGHAGDGGEDDDKGGDDLLPVPRGDGGEDEVENVAAADELVAGDGGVGEEDGDDAEDAGGLVVAGLEQVGDGELCEFAGAGRDEVDEEKAGPAAGGLPQRGEAVFVGVLGAGKERAGADPRREQREDENEGWKRASGNKVVCLRFYLGDAGKRDNQQGCHDESKNDRVEIHELRTSVLYRPQAAVDYG